MKKILVLKCGGTIGSAKTDGILSLENTTLSNLEILCDESVKNCELESKDIASLLSENIIEEDLHKIAVEISKIDINMYSGIVLTHGTDTLAYTSSYLSVLFKNYPLPIVIVSANYPISDKKSNAKANFSMAINFILWLETNIKNANGVYVSYQNPDSTAKIYSGDTILQCMGGAGYFYSADCSYIATKHAESCDIEVAKSFIENANFAKIQKSKIEISPQKNINVLPIKACSMLDYSVFDLSNANIDVIVCELFHSGTIRTVGKNNIISLISRAKEKNIPVVLASVSNGDIYESFKDLQRNSDVILSSFTFEKTYAMAKLGYYLG